ncbi:MAG: YihA family ribosome biogenesis GTP-binding protein [Victivallaceae bacterium]|nr:YihA family ribosome biogenesis GTP-binding protein [Victivallaceae bacterium]
MLIKSSEFITGAVDKKQFPQNNLPEIAFAGRSNVGKSSLINSLLNRRALARVGNTPGKTREINFFLINEAFRFVDLPGFGFAKVSKKEKARWRKYIESYLSSQRNIKAIVHVVDARHPGMENDLLMADFLNNNELLSCIVANKVDKLKKNEITKSVREITDIFGKEPILFSAVKNRGKSELWTTLERWLDN